MTAKTANNLTLFVILLATLLVMSIALPGTFLRPINLQNMARSLPEYGLLAFGIMLAMIVGGIDLSVVSVLSLSGVVASLVLVQHGEWGLPPVVMIILAILAALATAAACGLFNGFIITKAGVPAIIATLGTNGLFFGIAITLTRGHGVSGYPMEYLEIGNGMILGVPVPFLIFLGVALFLGLYLTRTAAGFRMYMLGSSPVAARFAGMNNGAILIRTFVLISLLAGISAIILTSKVATMRPNYGQNYLLVAVLLSLFGGTNPDGGFGTVLGVAMGIGTLQILSSGLTILGFTPFFEKFIYGVLLLLVMVIHFYRRTGGFSRLTERLRRRSHPAEPPEKAA